jgi:UDP-glucuronate decarboxylase
MLNKDFGKTFEWSFRNTNEVALNETITTKIKSRKFNLSIQTRRIMVTVSLGFLAILLTWLIQYQTGIDLDILLLYVMAASLYFGIRQGVLAILIASVSRVTFLLTIEKTSLTTLINDANLMMLLTLYLILGVCIGYTIDNKFHQNENIKNDLTKTKRELEFVNILYQKSLEVKNNLQLSIENSADSLGKLIHLISRMNHVKSDRLYTEVAAIFADILQARDVQVYSTDAAGLWLRLTATVGNAKFGKSITADQFDFLNAVYQERSIYINHDLNPRHPMICVPIYIGRQIDAIVFIDGVEFIKMNQQFVNTLKALTILVSESVENKFRQIEDLEGEKYFSNTILMKQKWFKKAIQDKITSNMQKAVLVKIGEKILNYRKFNRVVSNLVRSTDLVGELSQGQLGIIFIDTDQRYLSIIKERFTEKGYTIEKISESGGEENAGVHAGSQRTGHSGRLSSL